MAETGNTKTGGKKKLVFELDKKQIPFILVGFIIVGILIFLIGMMVGSNSAKKEFILAAADAKKITVSEPSLLEQKEGLSPGKSSDPQVLSKKGVAGPVKTEKNSAAIEKKTGKAAGIKKETKIKGAGPAEPERFPQTAASSGKSAPAKPGYFIQVGAFRKAEDAERRADQLKKKGYNVIVVKAEIPDKGTWHRVRIGPFKELKEAKSFSLEFEKKERISTFITKG